jgi:TolB protein
MSWTDTRWENWTVNWQGMSSGHSMILTEITEMPRDRIPPLDWYPNFMRRWLLPGLIFVSGLITACSPEGVRLPQSPLTAALERRSGLIAYIGNDGNVYTIDQGGGNQTMLTADAQAADGSIRRFYDFPAWSIEDNRLAFVGFDITDDGRTSAQIYATERDGEDPIEIYSSDQHVPFYLYWSPDGEWVSFLSSSPGSNTMAMQMASADGQQASLVDTGRPYYWAWSPEGMEVMAHVGGSASANPGGARISRLQLDPEVREIGLGILPTSFQAPAYSPNGEFVLLAGDGGGGQSQLILTDSEGFIEDTLVDYQGSIAFAWSPDGDYAAYMTGDSRNEALIGDLSILDLRRPSAPKTIEVDADQVVGFFWSPNSEELAYFVPTFLSAAEEGEEQTPENTVFLLELHVAEARTGESERIAAFQPTVSFLNMIPFFDQYQRSITIWSPDSNYILLSAIASEQQQGLFIVPASGNFEPRFLTEGTVGFWSWE